MSGSSATHVALDKLFPPQDLDYITDTQICFMYSGFFSHTLDHILVIQRSSDLVMAETTVKLCRHRVYVSTLEMPGSKDKIILVSDLFRIKSWKAVFPK